MSLTQKQIGEYRELARLIRVGSKLRPQARKRYFDGVGTCAIGAAVEAKFGVTWVAGNNFAKYENKLPAGDGVRDDIISMNDAGKSREQIADWLDAQASEAEINGEGATVPVSDSTPAAPPSSLPDDGFAAFVAKLLEPVDCEDVK